MEKTSLDNVNTVHQLANLFWKLNKFRQTLMCSMCVTQTVTITFSESLFKTICQRSDFNVRQSWFVFCFHLILKKQQLSLLTKASQFQFTFHLLATLLLVVLMQHWRQAVLKTSHQSLECFDFLPFLHQLTVHLPFWSSHACLAETFFLKP